MEGAALAKSFRGGVHPADRKAETASRPIKQAQEPKRVVIPLSQHTGCAAQPLVEVGEQVKVGQKIGEAQGFVSATVHASIAGKVIAIEPHPHPSGRDSPAIIIENNGSHLLDEKIKPRGELSTLSGSEIKGIVKEAGVVGMGGAAFPTHVKLSPPANKQIDSFILNCAECEPYLTCDYRLLLERTEATIYGMRVLMKALGVRQGYIGIEDNKPAAIKAINLILSGMRNAECVIRTVILRTKYPQGAEKQLIKAVLNRVVPLGGLPLDIGVVVNNVGTAYAVACAIREGWPLIKRIVTVAGSGVARPQNLEVKLGTTFADVVEQCGGLSDNVKKVIMGGPMMGIAQRTLEVPVIKGTGGILLFTQDELAAEKLHPCIRCARCVDNCPLQLLPLYLGTYAEKGLWKKCEELGAPDCIECGCCAYACSAGRPIVQLIKLAKAKIIAHKK